ncbi:DUF349 domain-containing protein [Microbacterium oryzae]|uniref:DUF349 domain-containing protein n=1 Tax=Microbacterium oryzae TaxID=743009 RepID=A0A6I6DUX3_9MICO|nr:DUF349 domain-containing protein [Microbacterium oryzae]
MADSALIEAGAIPAPTGAESADEETPAGAPEPGSAPEPTTAAGTELPADGAAAAEPTEAADAALTDAEPTQPADATPDAAPAAPEQADAAPAEAPTEPGEVVIEETWGRVTENGVVSVREGDQWRVVGEFPDGTPQEALDYFVRKFADLEFKVSTLEQRRTRGGASASDLRGQATRLQKDVSGATAVGDLAGLEQRLTALVEALAEATAEEAAAARAAVDAAIVERTGIVEKAEALAARDPKTVQWKQATADLADLFAAWQSHQQNGPRLPKAQAQALWKRFRDARSTVERQRRAFFAELDEVHKSARDAKNRLIERAEALAPRGEDGIPSYRTLLDEWKRSGRAGRKADDALWARFKAAGDALYQARTERDQAEQAESAPRIEARRALLEEAKVVADTKDLTEARRILTGIQRRWDEVGRIFPRDVERGLDDQMRRIEQELKQREDLDWKRNNPETKARANDLGGQLREAIEKLQEELAAAEAQGDPRAIADAKEALEARQAWLRAIGG